MCLQKPKQLVLWGLQLAQQPPHPAAVTCNTGEPYHAHPAKTKEDNCLKARFKTHIERSSQVHTDTYDYGEKGWGHGNKYLETKLLTFYVNLRTIFN